MNTPMGSASGLSPAELLFSLPGLLTVWHLALVLALPMFPGLNSDLFVFVIGTYVILVLPTLLAWRIHREASVQFSRRQHLLSWSGRLWWLLLLAVGLAIAVRWFLGPFIAVVIFAVVVVAPALATWATQRAAASNRQPFSWLLRGIGSYVPWLLLWTCFVVLITSSDGKFRGAIYFFTALDLLPPLIVWAVLTAWRRGRADGRS
jgi:hypothetical protein